MKGAAPSPSSAHALFEGVALSPPPLLSLSPPPRHASPTSPWEVRPPLPFDDDALWAPPSGAPGWEEEDAPSSAAPARRRRRRLLALKALALLLGCCAVLAALGACAFLVVQARALAAVVAAAGAFTLAATLISLAEVAQHLACFVRPALQRHEIRILLMVPVYATTSLLALASPPAAPFASAARECYEAFTIHSFVCFVLAWLEADAAMSFCTYAELLAAQPAVPHPWPLRACLRPWPMGAPFVARVRWGVVNYVAVRLLTAALSVALALAGSPGLFAEGDFSPRRAYVYAAALNSASQAWALYCLVMLYHAARNDLAGGGVRVLPKFLCVKGVVFATFWQGLAIAVAFHLGAARLVPRGSPGDTAAQTATRLQSFLVCVEMAGFALAHSWAFSAAEHAAAAASAGGGDPLAGPPPRPVAAAIADALDLRDVGGAVAGQVRGGAAALAGGAAARGRALLAVAAAAAAAGAARARPAGGGGAQERGRERAAVEGQPLVPQGGPSPPCGDG